LEKTNKVLSPLTLAEYAPFFALAKINDAETLFCPVGPLSFPGSLLVVGY
jgi:hypothetical protein